MSDRENCPDCEEHAGVIVGLRNHLGFVLDREADTQRHHNAKIEAQAAEIERLREALQAKPWPPTDADLREMLAVIVGAWWSESSANRLRKARALNPQDIKGMYAVRDALAPFIARAALGETK